MGSKNCSFSVSLCQCHCSLHCVKAVTYLPFQVLLCSYLTYRLSHVLSVAVSAQQKSNKITCPACVNVVQTQSMFNTLSQMQWICLYSSWRTGMKLPNLFIAFLPLCWVADSLGSAGMGAVKAVCENGGVEKVFKWIIKDSFFKMRLWCIDRVVAKKHMLSVTVLCCG